MDSTRPRPAPTVLSRRALASLVLIEMNSGRYYALDGVGARIWELCDGARTLADIAAVVAGEYRADLATVRADLRELVGHLHDEGLIRAA